MGQLTAALYGALFVYLGGWFAGRWSGNFALLLFLVFGEIAHYNVARAIRSLDLHEAVTASLRRRDVLGALELQHVAPCNALSISEATGIPRETVRRKVKELEARGMIGRQGARKLTLTREAIEKLQSSGLDITGDFLKTARTIRILQDVLARRTDRTPSSGTSSHRARVPRTH